MTPKFKFNKNDKIDYDTILDGKYVPDSDLKESFEEIELCKIHSNYIYDNANDDDNYIVIIFKHIAMTGEIHFIWHVANGIQIIIPQGCYSICTLFQILFSGNIFIEQHFSRAFVGRFFYYLT